MDNKKTLADSSKGNASLLDKIITECKTGQEPLTFNDEPLTFSLFDFWRWSVSDIISNATRGRFAEFIVATATNIDINIPRNEWAAYDLETREGIKIEIKSAAYIQAWSQKDFSPISFSIKLHRHLSSEIEENKTTAKRHADIYVFCVLTSKDQKTVNPLNMWILSSK